MINLPPRIYLIGARGSGKTTVGRLLAGRLGWSFVDMDDVIELHEQLYCSVFLTRAEAAELLSLRMEVIAAANIREGNVAENEAPARRRGSNG